MKDKFKLNKEMSKKFLQGISPEVKKKRNNFLKQARLLKARKDENGNTIITCIKPI